MAIPNKYKRKEKKTLTSKVKVLEKKVRVTQPETKWHNFAFTNTGVDNVGTLWSIDAIPEGSTEIERNGYQVKGKTLNFRYVLESETNDAYNMFRIMVVRSKGRTLVAGDFPGTSLPLTPVQKEKMTVLYDKTHNLQSFISGNPVIRTVKYYGVFSESINLRNTKINFGVGGTISNHGMLYLYAVSDSSAAPHPDLEVWNSNLEFTDA